jgi:uncharacterized membrane protein YecN with MAPEG domain
MLSATRIGSRYATTTVSRATLVRRSFVSAFRQGAPATGTPSSDWALAAAGGVALTLAAVSDARSTTYTSLASRVPVGGAFISTGTPVTEKATGIASPQLCNGKDSTTVEGGIEAIVSAMAAHENVIVQMMLCCALGNAPFGSSFFSYLASCPSPAAPIAAYDGIEAIVSAMTAHSNESEVQEQGCVALGILARENDANRVSIAANDGIEAIVSAMTAHSNISEMQQCGCYALGSLARDNDANRVSIAANDGVEAIVSAMTAHSNISEMQQCGCYALGNLACNDANSVSIAAKDGIEAIVSAMTAHSNESKVQEHGCAALGYIAQNNDANRVSIAAKDGIEAVVSAMTAHSTVSKVQEEGCLTLSHLACNSDTNRVSIAAKHGIDAIVSAMTMHSNVSKVQDYGCMALLQLTFNESVAVRIQLEGGVAVLEQNPSNSYAETALQSINKALSNDGPFVGFLFLQNLVCELGKFILGRKR